MCAFLLFLNKGQTVKSRGILELRLHFYSNYNSGFYVCVYILYTVFLLSVIKVSFIDMCNEEVEV